MGWTGGVGRSCGGVIRQFVQWKLPAQVLKDPRPQNTNKFAMLIAKFALVFSLYRAVARRLARISPALRKGSTLPMQAGRQAAPTLKVTLAKNNATQQRGPTIGYTERNSHTYTHTHMQSYIINNYCLFRKATSSSSSPTLSGLFIIILLPYFIISTAHF